MNIRKIVTVVEEIHRGWTGGLARPGGRRRRRDREPWAGQGFVEDLNPGIEANASDLGACSRPRSSKR